MKHRDILHVLLISFLFSNDIELVGLNLQLSEVFVAIIIVLVFATVIIRGRTGDTFLFDKNYTLIYISIGLFLAHSIIVTVDAHYPEESLKGVVKWLFGMGTMALVIFLNDYRTLGSTYKWLIYSLTVYMVTNLLFLLTGLKELHLSGLSGFALHSNSLGQLSAILSVLALTLVLSKKHIQRKYYILIFIIGLITTILSYNKTAMLILCIISIAIAITLRYHALLKYKFRNILFLIFFATLSYFTFSIVFRERLWQLKILLETPLKYKTIELRLDLWRQVIEIVKENPFTGIGYYNSPYFLFDYSGHSILHAHNILFEIMISAGIPGLVFFIFMIISIIVITYRNIDFKHVEYLTESLGLYFVVLVYLLLNMMSGSFSPKTHWYFWTSIGLLLASNAKMRIYYEP